MSTSELQYLNLVREVWVTGEPSEDRTGVGTRKVFGRQLRFDLSEGFPLLTTKEVNFAAVASELLWFLEGSGDERRLCEIRHGTRDPAKKTIWTANANAPYWKPKAEYEGDLGRVYGVQWRYWRTYSNTYAHTFEVREDGSEDRRVIAEECEPIDQIAGLIKDIQTNPSSRRMLVTAWNPGELSRMALPPCHLFSQWNVRQSVRKLDCLVYIRSNDLFLGAPFNIASYALLVHIIASITGYEPGDLVYSIGDAHIYQNHGEAVHTQLMRAPLPLPKLLMDPRPAHIDDLKMEDFKIIGYAHHPAIKAEMAV